MSARPTILAPVDFSDASRGALKYARVIAEHFGAARLNKPNDLICAPNGDIIFTDPPFGMRDENGEPLEREYPFSGVFRISASDGSLTPLVDNVAWPNGLALTVDGLTLYVNDSFERVVYAFPI